jgi:Protein of unknown function (DUF3429)
MNDTPAANKEAAIRVSQTLTYAGATPFVIGAIWLLLPNTAESIRVLLANGITTYAAVIISFLGGIQWGVGVATLDQQPKTARSLFFLSVIPSLLAWGMLFLQNTSTRVIVALLLIGFVWLIDALLNLQRVIPAWFFQLRSRISPVVMAALLVALISQSR